MTQVRIQGSKNVKIFIFLILTTSFLTVFDNKNINDNKLILKNIITSTQNWNSFNLGIDIQETITGVVNIYNKSESINNFIIGFKTQILGYQSSSTSNEQKWSLLITSGYIRAIIRNSLLNSQISGAYISLSNGTILSISGAGKILWQKDISNKTLSSLGLIAINNSEDHYIVTGGDEKRLYWLNSSGNIVKNNSINSEIIALKTLGENALVGTLTGDIYAYKGLDLAWNYSLGLNPVLGLNFNEHIVVAYSYDHDIIFLNPITGIRVFQLSLGNLLIDSIYFDSNNTDYVYMAASSGELLAIQISTQLKTWSSLVYPTTLSFCEFTGDPNIDLIVGTKGGSVIVFNQTIGVSISDQDLILGQVEISLIIPFQYNNDNITDLLIGTLRRGLWVVEGKDLTSPKFLEISLELVTYNSFNVQIVVNEKVRVVIRYGIESLDQAISKNEYQFNHTMYLVNLQAESNYFIQIEIWDQADNSAISEIYKKETKTPPFPFLFVIILLIVILVVFSAISGFFYYRKRKKHQAYLKGVAAQEKNHYTEAIKYYSKAHASEKILELVKSILHNPDLAIEAGEIMQMKEVEGYLSIAHDLIQEEKKLRNNE